MSHDLTETALAALTPNAGTLNRDRVLFEAGRQSARTPWHWPALTLAFAALSAVLGWKLLTQTPMEPPVAVTPKVIVPLAEPPAPESPAPARESHWGKAFHSSAGYFSQRDRVLHFGVESLPTAPAADIAPSNAITLEDLLKSS